MNDGHRLLCRDSTKAPTQLLLWDPCPFGVPVILTLAHPDTWKFSRKPTHRVGAGCMSRNQAICLDGLCLEASTKVFLKPL